MRISDWSSDVCSSDLDLAVGVYVGFDEPRTLGPHDTGSNVAAPVFKAFMADALTPEDAVPFRIPPGIRMVRLNAETGQLARPGDPKAFLEAFKPGPEPPGRAQKSVGSGKSV